MTQETPISVSGAVVVGLDDEQPDQLVLEAAIAFAEREHRRIHVLHAYDPTPWALTPLAMYPPPQHVAKQLREGAQEIVDLARNYVVERAPVVEVTSQLSELDPRETLRTLSQDAALVVVGSRGRSRMTGLHIGSVSHWVSQHAHCPVVVVRAAPDRAARVVVGTDDTAASAAAVDYAFAQASLQRLPLTVVHCVDLGFRGGYGVFDVLDEDLDDLPGERRALAESLSGLREKYVDVDVSMELALGPASSHLSAVSEEASLVVVGSHHRNVAGRLVHGAVSGAVVEHARCSVAVVAGVS